MLNSIAYVYIGHFIFTLFIVVSALGTIICIAMYNLKYKTMISGLDEREAGYK